MTVTDFLLIHGGAHGSWCWERLVPYLEASGSVNRVIAVDLCLDAQAAVNKPKAEINNADYAEGVIHRITELGLRDLVIVGHSMAGITIPAVCHRIPERVKRVIYLATSNPVVGQSVAELMAHPLSPLSRKLGFQEMFCNDLDESTVHWLLSQLQDDPPLPFHDKVRHCVLPDGLPSTYVICTNDQALPVAFQREQARNAHVDEVLEFDAGHSAFASRPQALATLLLRYA